MPGESLFTTTGIQALADTIDSTRTAAGSPTQRSAGHERRHLAERQLSRCPVGADEPTGVIQERIGRREANLASHASTVVVGESSRAAATRPERRGGPRRDEAQISIVDISVLNDFP